MPTPIRGGKAATARAVGSYMPKLARKAFEQHGFSTTTLLTSWGGIVGAEFARTTTPERLVWPHAGPRGRDKGDRDDPRRGATFVLSVDPSRALEIEYKAHQILERLNIYFGYRAIDRLRIRQAPFEMAQPAMLHGPSRGPGTLAPPMPEILAIHDPALRDALARLRTSVLTSSQARV